MNLPLLVRLVIRVVYNCKALTYTQPLPSSLSVCVFSLCPRLPMMQGSLQVNVTRLSTNLVAFSVPPSQGCPPSYSSISLTALSIWFLSSLSPLNIRSLQVSILSLHSLLDSSCLFHKLHGSHQARSRGRCCTDQCCLIQIPCREAGRQERLRVRIDV
jgi:hypothetical protein